MPRTSFLTFGATRASANAAPTQGVSARPARVTRKLTKRRPAPKSIAYDSFVPAKVGDGKSLKTILVDAFHAVREILTRPYVTRALHKRIKDACAQECFETYAPVWTSDVFELLLSMKPQLAHNRKLQAQVTDEEIRVCTQAAAFSIARSMGLAYPPFNLEARVVDGESIPPPPASTLLAPQLPAPELSSRGPTPPVPARDPRRKMSASSRVVTEFAAEVDTRLNGGLRTPSLEFMRSPSLTAEAPVHVSSPTIVAPTPRPGRVSRVLSSEPTPSLAQRGATHFPRLSTTISAPATSYSPMSPYSRYIETPDLGEPFDTNLW